MLVSYKLLFVMEANVVSIRETIFLNFLNWTLSKINKNPIQSPLEFVKISRNDLLTIDAISCEKEWRDMILCDGGFTAKEINYYFRKNVKSYVISLIKSMSRLLNYQLKRSTKRTQHNNVFDEHYIYTLVKK